MIRPSFIIICMLALVSASGQPLTGIKSIPVDYQSIKLAVDAINQNGVGPGGVIFNVAAGHTEVSSNILFTDNSVSFDKPVLFQKSGTGSNPIIYAAPGVSDSIDGIVVFQGTDFVTFDGINVEDPPTNTTLQTRMEFGFAILMAAPDNASRSISLLNCHIKLQNDTIMTSQLCGIYSKNHTAMNKVLIPPTDTSGVVSHCRFDSCTISQVNYGIYFWGSSSTDYYGKNNTLGDSLGNKILNYGGSALTTFGINTKYQDNLRIEHNTMINTYGSSGFVNGIATDTGFNANAVINGNLITLNCFASTANVHGITNRLGGSGTNNSVYITNNTVSIQYPTVTTGGLTPIRQSASAWQSYIQSNELHHCTYGSDSAAATGWFQAIVVTGGNTLPGSLTEISDNSIHANARIQSQLGDGYNYGINVSNSGRTCQISGNEIHHNSWPGTKTTNGIYCKSTTATLVDIYENQVYEIETPNAVTNVLPRSTNIFGIWAVGGVGGSTVSIYNNTVSNLTTSWGGQILPVYCTGSNAAEKRIFGNTVFSTNSNDVSTWAIGSVDGANVSIYNNRIYDLLAVGDSGNVYGICTGSNTPGSVTRVYNNIISELNSPEQDWDFSAGLYLYTALAGTNFGFYHNTVYLNQIPVSGKPMIAAAYLQTGPSVEMRNNILVNTSTPIGNGITAAVMFSDTGVSGYSQSSGYNCLYAGNPEINKLLCYAAGNPTPLALQTLAHYQNHFPQEDHSFSELPPFLNTVATPCDLHLDENFLTACESGGNATGDPDLSLDFDADPRFPNTGYPVNTNPVFLPVAVDVGADEFGGMSSLIGFKDSQNEKSGIHLVPNPCSGSFSLILTESIPSPVQIALYTGQGELVFSEIREKSGIHPFSIPDPAPGIYLLKIQSGKMHKTAKLAVIR